jgi:hypothetical protein
LYLLSLKGMCAHSAYLIGCLLCSDLEFSKTFEGLHHSLGREAFRFRLETIVRGQANARSGEEELTAEDVLQRRQQNEAAMPMERPAMGVGRDWQAVATAQRVESEATAVYDMELRELLGRWVLSAQLTLSKCYCYLGCTRCYKIVYFQVGRSCKEKIPQGHVMLAGYIGMLYAHQSAYTLLILGGV